MLSEEDPLFASRLIVKLFSCCSLILLSLASELILSLSLETTLSYALTQTYHTHVHPSPSPLTRKAFPYNGYFPPEIQRVIARYKGGSLNGVKWTTLAKFLRHYRQKYRPNKSELIKRVTDLLVADGHPVVTPRTHESEAEVRGEGRGEVWR